MTILSMFWYVFLQGLKLLILFLLAQGGECTFAVSKDSTSLTSCILENYVGRYADGIVAKRLCFNGSHELIGSNEPNSQKLAQCFKEHLPFAIVPENELSGFVSVPGPWFVAQNYYSSMQFGHATSKFIQYFGLNFTAFHYCGSQVDLKYMSLFQAESDYAHHMTKSLEHIMTRTFDGRTLEDLKSQKLIAMRNCSGQKNCVPKNTLWPHPATCFEDAIHIINNEMMFPNEVIGHAFRSGFAQLESCPTPRVVFLYRTGGAGLRTIVNFMEVVGMLREFGITVYENITISGKSSVPELVGLFSNVSLLISPHSSQLKGLLYARKGTAVLELRAPDPHPIWQVRDPFGVGSGFDTVGIITQFTIKSNKFVNRGNKFDNTYRADFIVGIPEAREAVRSLLLKQKAICGPMKYA